MTEVKGFLRDFRLSVPEAIYTCNGIKICGRRIKLVLFSTDVSIIRNSNADAVIAVYPFTPQPVITQAVMMAADTPVFVGIGGGLTKGERVLGLGRHAEYQGAFGVVVNAPTPNSTVKELKEALDIHYILAPKLSYAAPRNGHSIPIALFACGQKCPIIAYHLYRRTVQLAHVYFFKHIYQLR